MIDLILNLPLWEMIRTLGISSYILLTVGMCLGITYGLPVWSGKTKASLYKLHTFCTVGGTGLGMLHGVITVIDTYMPFSWTEVLVPFAAHNHPVLNGLGTLAGYGMLVVILTSDLRQRLGKKLWLTIHLMSYPIFAMALVHGFFTGTDSHQAALEWIYPASVVLLVGLSLVRFLAKPASKKASGMPV